MSTPDSAPAGHHEFCPGVDGGCPNEDGVIDCCCQRCGDSYHSTGEHDAV